MRFFHSLLAADLAALTLLPAAHAQGNYPPRPITFLTGMEAQ
ncbi:MAG TPA: hypothetical protein VLK85_36055 [Ramlibacter sp.]|nr:hypothetical protein [Ramlibacter sp.]